MKRRHMHMPARSRVTVGKNVRATPAWRESQNTTLCASALGIAMSGGPSADSTAGSPSRAGTGTAWQKEKVVALHSMRGSRRPAARSHVRTKPSRPWVISTPPLSAWMARSG
eukprot:scaffold1336_cov36-Tisochrysis_lutea.AAC.2